jgi:MFS family permease
MPNRTAHWLLHLKGVGVPAADAAWAMGLFTLGAVFGRLIGGMLMDWMVSRYAFMLGLCLYFPGSFLAIRVSPAELWIAYNAAILYGTAFGWTLHMPEHRHRAFLWSGSFSQVERNAAAGSCFLFAGRISGRKNI